MDQFNFLRNREDATATTGSNCLDNLHYLIQAALIGNADFCRKPTTSTSIKKLISASLNDVLCSPTNFWPHLQFNHILRNTSKTQPLLSSLVLGLQILQYSKPVRFQARLASDSFILYSPFDSIFWSPISSFLSPFPDFWGGSGPSYCGTYF